MTPLVDQIVYASTAYTDLKSALNQQSQRLVDFSLPSAGAADERLRAAVRLITPRHPVGIDLVRVGGRHDGGYLMVEDFQVAGAVSVGVGPDVSWDLDVSRRGVTVAMFDPTIRRLPTKVPGGSFHRVGISGPHSPSVQYRPLGALVALAGFAAGADLLLKIDAEGAEWSALSSLADNELLRYRQIVIEMHQLSRLNDQEQSREVLGALGALAVTHVPVHLHANNYSRLLRFDTDWFPDAVEVSYVRRDLLGATQPPTRVRSPLDVPSDTRVEEIDLEGVLTLASG